MNKYKLVVYMKDKTVAYGGSVEIEDGLQPFALRTFFVNAKYDGYIELSMDNSFMLIPFESVSALKLEEVK